MQNEPLLIRGINDAIIESERIIETTLSPIFSPKIGKNRQK
jgi:hypothetical protein